MSKQRTFNDLLNVKEFDRVIVNMTYTCNFHCEECVTHEWGTTCIKPKELRKFLDLVDGVGMDTPFQLTGGEPTYYFDTFLEVVELLHEYGRKVWVLTNGYGVLDIPASHLEMIELFRLDDHGINTEHISECLMYVTPFCDVTILPRHTHYNYERAIELGKDSRKDCNKLFWRIIYRDGVIYPCVNINGGKERYDELWELGFNVYNQELLQTLQNWREILPETIYGFCDKKCPTHGIHMLRTSGDPGVKIQLHSNDIIKRSSE